MTLTAKILELRSLGLIGEKEPHPTDVSNALLALGRWLRPDSHLADALAVAEEHLGTKVAEVSPEDDSWIVAGVLHSVSGTSAEVAVSEVDPTGAGKAIGGGSTDVRGLFRVVLRCERPRVVAVEFVEGSRTVATTAPIRSERVLWVTARESGAAVDRTDRCFEVQRGALRRAAGAGPLAKSSVDVLAAHTGLPLGEIRRHQAAEVLAGELKIDDGLVWALLRSMIDRDLGRGLERSHIACLPAEDVAAYARNAVCNGLVSPSREEAISLLAEVHAKLQIDEWLGRRAAESSSRLVRGRYAQTTWRQVLESVGLQVADLAAHPELFTPGLDSVWTRLSSAQFLPAHVRDLLAWCPFVRFSHSALGKALKAKLPSPDRAVLERSPKDLASLLKDDKQHETETLEALEASFAGHSLMWECRAPGALGTWAEHLGGEIAPLFAAKLLDLERLTIGLWSGGDGDRTISALRGEHREVPHLTPRARGAVARLQRLLRVGVSKRATFALARADYRSAHHIATERRAVFFAKLEEQGIDRRTSEQLRARAIRRTRVATEAYVDLRMRGAAGPSGRLGAASIASGSEVNIPSLEVLFGSQDYCDCPGCESVVSQAAYLVDQLMWLDRVEVTGGVLAYDVLVGTPTTLGRRPDLVNVELSCNNSEIAIPQIDIVCELLEDRIATSLQISVLPPRQTMGGAEEVHAYPEHLNDEVYKAIAEAIVPGYWPFYLFLEESRRYLAELKSSRGALIGAFIGDMSPEYVIETLGISTGHADTLTKVDEANQPLVWGAALADITVETLLRRGSALYGKQLVYEELVLLLGNGFVAGGLKLAIKIIPDPQTGSFDDCRADGRNVPSLTLGALDRLHRMLRLARVLGWSPSESCSVFAMLATNATAGVSLDALALRRMSHARELAEDFSLDPVELAVWFGAFDLGAPASGAFYEKLFADRGQPPSGSLYSLAPSLGAALGLSAADATNLIVQLNLSNELAGAGTVAELYRHVRLAESLHLRMPDYLSLLAVSKRDPFAEGERGQPDPKQTIEFVRDYRRGAAVGLGAPAIFDVLAPGPETIRLDVLWSGLRGEQGRVFARLESSPGTFPLAQKETIRLHADAFGAGTAGDFDVAFEKESTQEDVVGAINAAAGFPMAAIPSPSVTALRSRAAGQDVGIVSVSSGALGFSAKTVAPDLRSGALWQMPFANWMSLPSVAAGEVSTLLDTSFSHEVETILAWAKVDGTPRLPPTDPIDPPKAPSDSEVAALQRVQRLGTLVQMDSQHGDETRLGWRHNPALLPLCTDGLWAGLTDYAACAEAGSGEMAPAAPLFRAAPDTGQAPAFAKALDLDLTIATALLTAVPSTREVAGAANATLSPAQQWCVVASRVREWRSLGLAFSVVQGAAKPATADTTNALRNAFRTTLPRTEWLARSAKVQDDLRPRRRDGLVNYLNATSGATAESLSEELLIDVATSDCRTRSRIQEASAAIQTFVTRIILGVEAPLEYDPVDSEWEQWEWRKRYSLWRGNRLIYLFPENYMSISQRSTATPLFQTFQDTMARGTINKENVSSALLDYLGGLTELADLEYLCVGSDYKADPDDYEYRGIRPFAVVGRSRGTPARYYFNQLSGGSWGAFEEVSIKEDPLHLAMYTKGTPALGQVVILFWPKSILYPRPDQASPDASGKVTAARSILGVKYSWVAREADSSQVGGWGQSRTTSGATLYDGAKITERRLLLQVSGYGGGLRPGEFTVDAHLPQVRDSTAVSLVSSVTLQRDTTLKVTYARGGGSEDPDPYALGDPKGWSGPSPADELLRQYASTRRVANPGDTQYVVPWDALVPDQNRMRSQPTDSAPASALSLGPTKSVNKTLITHPATPYSVTVLPWRQLGTSTDHRIWPSSWAFFVNGVGWSFFVVEKDFVDKAGTGKVGLGLGSRYFGNNPSRPYAAVPAYHPFATGLLQRVSSDGLDALYKRLVQRRPGHALGVPARSFAIDLGLNTDVAFVPSNVSPSVDPNVPDVPSPAETIDFVGLAPYTEYNWELFFHAPMLVASRLRAAGRYSESRDFMHYVFNPMEGNGRQISLPNYDTTNLTIGTPVYVDNSDPNKSGGVKMAQANAAETMDVVGIVASLAVAPLKSAQIQTGGVLTATTAQWDAVTGAHGGLVVKSPYYLNNAKPGRLTATAPTTGYVVQVGLAVTATDLQLDGRRWWTTAAFDGDDRRSLEDIVRDDMNDGSAYAAVLSNPFDAHKVAKARPSAYERFTVLEYVQNLLDWADALFRAEGLENIDEATQLYGLAAKLLGDRPLRVLPVVPRQVKTFGKPSDWKSGGNVIVQETVENLLSTADPNEPETKVRGLPVQLLHGATDGDPGRLYFSIPVNDKLLGYWDRVETALANIRLCKSLDGGGLAISGLDTNVDVRALANAAAAGGPALRQALSPTNQSSLGPRFRVLIAKAIEFCGDARALGAGVVAASEKEDAEHLARLRSQWEGPVLERGRAAIESRIDEARRETDVLQAAMDAAVEQWAFYSEKTDKNQKGRERLSSAEQAAFGLNVAGAVVAGVASALEIAAAPATAFPDLTIGVSGAMASPVSTIKIGGSNVGGGIQAAARSLSAIGGLLDRTAGMVATQAGYDRRWDDWQHQAELAKLEIARINKQLVAADVRQRTAEAELATNQAQHDAWTTADEFLREKFTVEELYVWLLEQTTRLHVRAYELALDMAQRAADALAFEAPDAPEPNLHTLSWNAAYRGGLAAEELSCTLRQMEADYLRYGRFDALVSRHFSLRNIAPKELLKLRKDRACTFAIPKGWLERLDPGLRDRRIRSVAVSLPCVVGPYASINAVLRLVSPRPAHSLDMISLSTGINDTGWDMSRRAEEYVPFEGAPIDETSETVFALSLPQHSDVVPDTIADVVLTIEYSANKGSGGSTPIPLREMVIDLEREAPEAWLALAQSPAHSAMLDVDAFTPSLISDFGSSDFKMTVVTSDSDNDFTPTGDGAQLQLKADGATWSKVTQIFVFWKLKANA